MREFSLALLLGSALSASAVSVAAETPQARCVKDALETWYCALDEKGVAVLDNKGVVQCAPGACVEVDDEWHCSALSGGRAAATPQGLVCEGGCRSPRAVDCERGVGPS